MSFHTHLRATGAGEVPEDFASLSDFMWDSWDLAAEGFAAGISMSIQKDFNAVDSLYTGVTCHSKGASLPNTLPIYGGRLISNAAKDQPPFVILDPPQVREAAEFLETVSFDGLWQAAPPEVTRPYQGWDEAEVKNIFIGYHDKLRAFYKRATLAEQAVIKAFYF